jgi:hypothetical protein
MDVIFIFLTFYCINFYVELQWSSIPDISYGISLNLLWMTKFDSPYEYN